MKLKKNRIIINGIGGSGKDHVVNMLTEKLHNFIPDLIVSNYSTIDRIREVVQSGFHIYPSGQKTGRERQLLADIKRALITFDDLPFYWTIAHSQRLNLENINNLMFIHCREGEEIAKLVSYWPDTNLTLLVQRDGITIPDCTADQGVDKYYGYDYLIYNYNSTLSEVLDVLVQKLLQP